MFETLDVGKKIKKADFNELQLPLRQQLLQAQFDLEEREGAKILSIFGGKVTTYRKLAEHALEKLEIGEGPGWTADKALPGGDFDAMGFEQLLGEFAREYAWADKDMLRRLIRAYGTRTRKLLEGVTSANGLGEHLGGDLYARELEYLCEAEFVNSAEDALWRRSKLGLHLDDAAKDKVARWFEARGGSQ